jgi:hypothetical protein
LLLVAVVGLLTQVVDRAAAEAVQVDFVQLLRQQAAVEL